LALKKIFDADNPIKIIGTRHGEKLYETLLTREEFAKAEDCGNYYRVVADNRDLNYNVFYTEGKVQLSQEQDYNSHNTRRLAVDELVELLMGLDYIKTELEGWNEPALKGQAI
jgi:UDP-N-acetylglucosamine 4,6-dehydratase/5-epimerase